MQHPDEGTIHAWLDSALPADEAQGIESHVATCASCAERVAEARGLIAASSRIVKALDDVPAHVIPAGSSRDETQDDLAALRMRKAAQDAVRRQRSWTRGWMTAAASLLFVAAGTILVYRQTDHSTALVDSVAVAQAARSKPVDSVRAAPSPSMAATPPAPAATPGEQKAASRQRPDNAARSTGQSQLLVRRAEDKPAAGSEKKEPKTADVRAGAPAVASQPEVPAPRSMSVRTDSLSTGLSGRKALQADVVARAEERKVVAAPAATNAVRARDAGVEAVVAGKCYAVDSGLVARLGLPPRFQLDTTQAPNEPSWRRMRLPDGAATDAVWHVEDVAAVETRIMVRRGTTSTVIILPPTPAGVAGQRAALAQSQPSFMAKDGAIAAMAIKCTR